MSPSWCDLKTFTFHKVSEIAIFLINELIVFVHIEIVSLTKFIFYTFANRKPYFFQIQNMKAMFF